MADFGIYEHVVTREAGRGSRLGKGLLWGLVLLGIFGLLWLGLAVKMFPLFLGISVAAAFAALLLFRRYSSLEFEYTMVEGVVTFSEIFGKSTRRVARELEIRACAVIAPIDDAKLSDFGAVDEYFAVSSMNAENIYGMAFDGEKGKKTIVYFEATDEALRICRAYNPRATVIKKI